MRIVAGGSLESGYQLGDDGNGVFKSETLKYIETEKWEKQMSRLLVSVFNGNRVQAAREHLEEESESVGDMGSLICL